MESKKVAGKKKYFILCSGVTLGVYVPAIMLERRLTRLGLDVEAVTFETLFLDEKREKLSDLKKFFHRDFNFALSAQKMSNSVQKNLDEDLLAKLYESWMQHEQIVLIVFSGFWIPVIEKYGSQRIDEIVCLHMDATTAASWKTVEVCDKPYRHVWLFRKDERSVFYHMGDNVPITPMHLRENRILIHGGGWGIGTYKQTIDKMAGTRFGLDLVAYETSDMIATDRLEYYLLDPDWSPWKVEGRLGFPNSIRKSTTATTTLSEVDGRTPIYQVLARCLAVISKPGGATLLDSLNSATPLIFLAPFGDYEKANGELWCNLGFGIHFDEWEKSGFSLETLKGMHESLMSVRRTLPDLVGALL